MDNDTQKIIEDQMKMLPNDVKQAIVSVDYQTKLQEITKRQRLLIDQAGKLEMETTLVMIGLEPLADYVANIERELLLNTIRAREVAMDVSENIFKPIRESLQKMNEEVLAKEENEEPAPKFTNSNEVSLNRDQILNEIENPDTISGGDRSMNFATTTAAPTAATSKQAEVAAKAEEVPNEAGSVVEIRPNQEIETVPGQGVRDIAKEIPADIVKTKMTTPTIISQQIVEAKPEVKLPEVKKKPSSGVDPYREPLI